MRKGVIIILALGCCFVLSSCSISRELENQAYALVMGLDRAPDGDVEMTIRIPKIGRSSENSADSQGSSPYLVFTSRGKGWGEALETMRTMVPRQLNLSHLKQLIVSEALASEAGFRQLVNQIAETRNLYTSARVVVCEGKAKDFIGVQKTVIGTRLSAEIDAMFDYYTAQGIVPDARLADMYYRNNSIYADPVAAWGFVAPVQDTEVQAGLIVDPSGRRDTLVGAPSEEFYAGTALFRDGAFVQRLSAAETQLMNLALGRTKSLPFVLGDTACTLAPSARPRKRIWQQNGTLNICLDMEISSIDAIESTQAGSIERALSESMRALIEKCRSLRVDPFGFAECAAAQFATIREWLDYDWRERFAKAGVEVRVRLHCAETEQKRNSALHPAVRSCYNICITKQHLVRRARRRGQRRLNHALREADYIGYVLGWRQRPSSGAV